MSKQRYFIGFWSAGFAVFIAFLWLFAPNAQLPALAQATPHVQQLTGTLAPNQFFYYRLPGLKQGDDLYLYAATTSGNLDPALGLIDGAADPKELEREYRAAVATALDSDDDPLAALEQVREEYFLVWDDDGSGGLAPAVHFVVPADGDYRLVIAGALSSLGLATAGDFKLLVGLDAPEVLTGAARSTGCGDRSVRRRSLPAE